MHIIANFFQSQINDLINISRTPTDRAAAEGDLFHCLQNKLTFSNLNKSPGAPFLKVPVTLRARKNIKYNYIQIQI